MPNHEYVIIIQLYPYVVAVLLPECVVRLICKFCSVGKSEVYIIDIGVKMFHGTY